MNEMLHAFKFEGQEIRMFGTPENPEWVASDICGVLGYSRTSDALRMVPDDAKGVQKVRTPGGWQEMTTLKEPGLYRLIFASRRPEAEPLRAKTFNEVLPSIRKTGSYSVKPMTQAQISLLQSQALVDLEAKQEVHEEKIKSLESRVESLAERAAHEQILPEEINTSAIAYRVKWFSRAGKLHTTAIAQVAKDRGFIQRGLARLADSWNEAAGWVKVLAFTVDGAKAFYQEIDEPFKGQDEFKVSLKSGKVMHVCREVKQGAIQ